MSAIEHEVASQPAVWCQAAALAAHAPLPAHGSRLAVVGCGTSLYVAQAYAAAREAAGHGETDAFAASEYPAARRYDALLAVSRSGTTTEVRDLLRAVAGETPTIAITATAGTPIGELAADTVLVPFADERSVVQTRFATSVLVLLLTHLGEDTEVAAADAERVLREPLALDPAAFRRFQFLGRGWTVGLASEAALKLREAAQAWTEAYPSMEYRHGPIALADEDTAVIAIGGADPALAAEIRATGAMLLDGGAHPLAMLVTAHRMAIRLAEVRGLDPDSPRNLTRSVVLP